MKKIILLIAVFFTLNISYSQENNSLDDEFKRIVKFVREHAAKLKQNKSANAWAFLKDSTQTFFYAIEGTTIATVKYTYDAQGKIIESIRTYTQVTPFFEGYLFYKYQFLYDVDNRLTQIISFGKEEINDAWIYISMHEYVYDAGNLVIELSKNWDTENLIWINKYKRENTYDSENNMIATIKYRWNTIDEYWRFYSSHDRIFNSVGLVLIEEVSYWNNQNEEWYYSHTIYSTYNANNDLLESLYKYNYGEIHRYLYLYTGSLLSSRHFQSWHGVTNGWLTSDSTYYYYDEYDNLVHEHWQSICPSSDTYHYYSRHPIGVPEESINTNKLLYPNPSRNTVYINATNQKFTVRITTTGGKEVLHLKNCKNAFDISDLPIGIYFVNILSDTNSYSAKLIKE